MEEERSRKQKVKAALQFIKNIKTTGAISETSRAVEIEMCRRLSPNNAAVIEFGLGHGNITREILRTIDADSSVISFEVNKEFIDIVQSELQDNRLQIILEDALNVESYIDDPIDNVVCSIPLTMFKSEKRKAIFEKAEQILKTGGVLSIVQYSKRILKDLELYFDRIDIVKVKNLPTAYIFHCYKS